MSTILMEWLLGNYIVIMVVCAVKGEWPWFCYWIGATILQISVIWMKITIQGR